jgi:hypothetical protein
MTPEEREEKDAIEAATRYLNRRCICCGDDEIDNYYRDEPTAKYIGEGVQMCADCVSRDHDEKELVEILLRSLAEGLQLLRKRSRDEVK